MANQWTLGTARGAYVVSLLPDASGLVLDHWGAQLNGPVIPWGEDGRAFQAGLPADGVPLEYASAGHRHVGFSELRVDHGDALVGSTWTCVSPDEIIFSSGASGASLDVTFVDETRRLALTLHTRTSSAHDVVTRWVTLDNRSDERTVTLPRAFSAGWSLPVGQSATINYLAGTWSQEFTPKSVDLDWGTFSIGSRSGTTGLLFNPVVSVGSTVDGRQNEAYGVALAWSGSWRLQAESMPFGDRLRVSAGLDDDTAVVTLLPGESFDSPTSLGVWSPRGAAGVSQSWHEFQRRELARSLDAAHRPIVYNSWYATEFDVRIEHQLELAEVASAVGVEVFVVDDGWFRGRTDDTAGLGDWQPDPNKFPDGLAPLAQAVIERGMRFGIWVEPEAVNADSDLFRAHPDWVYRAGDRALVTRRNQYVLDFGKAEVVDWATESLRTLLRSAPVSYLKWDMNRPVSDGGRPGDPHGREWPLQHARGYYRIMQMLRDEFPHVTIETCAAGGGRIDNASLALSDVVWPSDETGPRDRLGIQHGFLSAYPPHVMSSWVTDEPGLRDRSAVSFEFRFVVAMAGVLGIGSDLLGWTPEQVDRARELTELYKSIRTMVHTGTVIRHGRPTDPTYAVEFAVENGPACVLVWDHDRDRHFDREPVRVRPAGLAPDRLYRVRSSGAIVSGLAAATTGVIVAFDLAVDTDVIIFDLVS